MPIIMSMLINSGSLAYHLLDGKNMYILLAAPGNGTCIESSPTFALFYGFAGQPLPRLNRTKPSGTWAMHRRYPAAMRTLHLGTTVSKG
jgi:hypothetical protein